MWKKYASHSLWVLITIGFFLIPVADTRPIKSIPLYPLDGIFLLLILLSITLLFLQKREEKFSFSIPVVLAFGFLMFSSSLSWWTNGASLTGLGQLKSWLILPGIAGLLVPWAFQEYLERDRNFLRCWLAGLSGIGILLLPSLFFDQFTFDGRLQGPFTSPNFLAHFLFPGLILCWYFWKQGSSHLLKFLLFFLGIFFAYLLFLTHSFGGWLAATASIMWYGYHTSFLQKKYTHIFVLAIVFFGLVIGGEWLTNDKLSGMLSERSSLASRLTIWTVALEAGKDHPFFGIGMGRFQEVYLSYQPQFPPYLEWAVPEPHNLLLALWLQSGIVGLIVLVWLTYRALFVNKTTTEEHVLLQAALIGMCVYGIFDTPLFGNALALLWWMILGLLLLPVLKKEKAP